MEGGLTGLRDVTVAFDGRPALRGVTLLAAPGEILAILGPSGCGKTTVLRAVAGLDPVTAGRVLVAGRDVTAVPTPSRGVAMVFQADTLAPFLDVATNLGRAATARGERGPGPERRLADRVRSLRLGGLLARMPRTLSRGESGRAGIGRALVQAPAAFLLDEPLAHLDAAERARVRRTVVEVVRTAGVGALYVTHDQAEAMAVGDRLAVLRAGAVVQTDPPRDVYARPADTFVAAFVGEPEIGMLPATVVADGDGMGGYRVGSRTLPLWGPPPAGAEPGRDVLLGFRAEAVAAAGVDPDPATVTLPVVVRRVELTGAAVVLETDVTVPGPADGARLAVRVPRDARAVEGDRMELAVDARRAHVFDAADGRALHHPPAPSASTIRRRRHQNG